MRSSADQRRDQHTNYKIMICLRRNENCFVAGAQNAVAKGCCQAGVPRENRYLNRFLNRFPNDSEAARNTAASGIMFGVESRRNRPMENQRTSALASTLRFAGRVALLPKFNPFHSVHNLIFSFSGGRPQFLPFKLECASARCRTRRLFILHKPHYPCTVPDEWHSQRGVRQSFLNYHL